MLTLGGCGGPISQPLDGTGHPIDPPEPTAPPDEGLKERKAMRTRPPGSHATRRVARSGVRSGTPGRS